MRLFCHRRMMIFQVTFLSGLLLSCGGGSSSPSTSASSQSSQSVSSSISSQSTAAVLSGKITFDSIPHKPTAIGLDYANSQIKPARGLVVELIDQNGNILESSSTDAEGRYEFSALINQQVQVRIKASMQAKATPDWKISVRDNTQDNALYVMQGQLMSVASSNEIRNFHAASGWQGTAYTDSRSAAPFAILDSLYLGMEKLQQSGFSKNLPELSIYWSEKNTTAEGDVSLGEIGTSYYTNNAIYLLGDDDVDTDEYDSHVILHEWMHYLEDNVSRSDNIGGDHGSDDKLDSRVAFSEGLANAFSGMLQDDPIYKDALGNSQSSGFFIFLANKSPSVRGWYSQASVYSIFYNYYLSSLNRSEKSLTDLFKAFMREDYKNTPYFVSVYSFSDALKKEAPNSFPTWAGLLSTHNINSTLSSAEGEINTGGYAENLPVYKILSEVNPQTKVCASNRFGSINKLSIFQYVYLSIQEQANYQIQLTSLANTGIADPDVDLYLNGRIIARANTSVNNVETMQRSLSINNYLLTVTDKQLLDESTLDTTRCFQINLTRLAN